MTKKKFFSKEVEYGKAEIKHEDETESETIVEEIKFEEILEIEQENKVEVDLIPIENKLQKLTILLIRNNRVVCSNEQGHGIELPYSTIFEGFKVGEIVQIQENLLQ